jgi:hypothetical protein
MDEPIRVRCLACGNRLELPPRTNYAACRKCGSEYRVGRRGGAYALEPLTPEEFAVTQQVAAVEREQEMGCANTALSLLVGVVLLFCVLGGVGRLVFNNSAACLVAWVLALLIVVPGAVIMLRNLERDRRRKDRLLARQASAAAPESDTPVAVAAPRESAPGSDSASAPAPGG